MSDPRRSDRTPVRRSGGGEIERPSGRAFDRSQFERRLLESLDPSGQEKAYVSSVEGEILAKLDWYRLGGETSDRQWSDIVGVLKVQGERIDRVYLRQWAPTLGVDDLLERALADAGLT